MSQQGRHHAGSNRVPASSQHEPAERLSSTPGLLKTDASEKNQQSSSPAELPAVPVQLQGDGLGHGDLHHSAAVAREDSGLGLDHLTTRLVQQGH